MRSKPASTTFATWLQKRVNGREATIHDVEHETYGMVENHSDFVTITDKRTVHAVPHEQIVRAEVNADGQAESTLRFESYQDQAGEFRWRLRSVNGEIIAVSSEGYQAKAARDHSIELVQSSFAAALVDVNESDEYRNPAGDDSGTTPGH